MFGAKLTMLEKLQKKTHVIIIFFLFGHHSIYFVYLLFSSSICYFCVATFTRIMSPYLKCMWSRLKREETWMCAIPVHMSTTMSIPVKFYSMCKWENYVQGGIHISKCQKNGTLQRSYCSLILIPKSGYVTFWNICKYVIKWTYIVYKYSSKFVEFHPQLIYLN